MSGWRPGSRLGPQTSFLLPAPTEPGGYLRVTALGMPHDAPHHLSLVVVLSPCEDLHGLTHRELEVLGLLIAGQNNAQADVEMQRRLRTARVEVLTDRHVPHRREESSHGGGCYPGRRD